jgi:hypothetical protein
MPTLPNKKIGFIDSSKIRKQMKKENLRDARSHFPHRVNLTNLGCSVANAQDWLINHRYRSWKQKGLEGDYYYNNWNILYFKDKNVVLEFVLSLSK